MAAPRTPDDVLQQAADAYRAHGCQCSAAAAASIGIALGTFKSRIKIAAERGLLGTKPVLPGFRLTKTTAVTNQDGDVVREFIQQRPEAGEQFEPLPGHVVKGESALVGPDGQILAKWIKTREDAARSMALSAAIREEFDQYKGFAQLVPPPKETMADLCNYYPIVDPHIGALSYGKETGESNDLKIGVARVESTLQRLIGWSPPAETAVIINTGDFFHADDQRNATPASGHQLDVDGRDQKVKWVGVNMLRTTIDFALQRHKRVVVKNLKGNHDPESAKWLNISLGLFYSNEPRVEIDPADANNDHFFHLFGVNYVGATHGHTMKPDRMYVMMAEDNPKYWNASLYRWCIFGHIHHESKKQIGSLICESFSQPVPRDSFAHSNGYRSGSAMQSITLSREGGECSRLKQNFPPSRGRPVSK